MKQERAHVRAQRVQGRLADLIGEAIAHLDPPPACRSVLMVGVPKHSKRVIILTVAVNKHYVIGRYSLVKRQLDVAAYRPEEARPFFIADAKRHRDKLDVKDAEAFIGMVDDVGASMGVLVTPEGFTPAAERRARAASTSVLIMTVEAAMTYRWLLLAREIYPYDWIFHEDLAYTLRLLYERAQPEAVMDALESVSFEVWDLLVGYALAWHPDQARRFLLAVAQYHHDDGWRFNAVQHLMEANMLDKELPRELLQRESDPDTIELLENSLGDW